ncbi:hypothetical protein JQ608_38440 [Bradyrhizobium liaoningense]|uniref:hypothetical protein n=1 Tax=Bradyrhizobium liaoningense TaxID=43992 RepID=UPI001BAD464E|nr:hypothetical protein [Bradyrhizobium liaoningense]MBR0882904.1 hypothetical protein [Bradyrhizobium liaoningense]
MTDSTPEKKPPQTAAQRQHKYRESLQDKGLERIWLVVERSAAQRMRNLSRDHNVPSPDVFKLGMLIAQRELQAMEARKREQAQ